MTSRKLIISLLASMVMRNPLLLKKRHISFLMFSVSLGVALVMVTSHLATIKTRHQQTRHQYEISYYIKSKPNMIFSET